MASDLYAADAPVTGEDAGERNRAISAAFGGVLVKLTGDRNVATRAGYSELLALAPDLVQQYRYRIPENGGGAQRFLSVRFDELAVDRLLADRAWPVWREPRPRLLVWLVKEEAGRRVMVSPDQFPDISQALRGQAAARGVELQLPLMDLEDQSQLTAADAWSGFEPRILAASFRYGKGAVLVGRIKALGDGVWDQGWTLYDAGRSHPLAASPAMLQQGLASGIDQATDVLAGAYAPGVATSGPAPVRVGVSGLRGLRSYGQVLDILGNAAGVNRLSVRRAAGDLLVFDVWLDGDATDLAQEMGQFQQLQVDTVSFNTVGMQQLAYRWAP